MSRDVSSLTARDAAGVTVATMAVESPYRPKVYRVTNRGTKLPFGHATLQRLRVAYSGMQIHLLATRAGMSFYRFGTRARCFGTGLAGKPHWTRRYRGNPLRLYDIACSSDPFSPAKPLRDNSIWGQDAGDAAMHLYTFVGIASNEVVAIDLVNADGTLIERVPVQDSV